MNKYNMSANSAVKVETARRLFDSSVKTEYRATTVFKQPVTQDPFAARVRETVKSALVPQGGEKKKA